MSRPADDLYQLPRHVKPEAYPMEIVARTCGAETTLVAVDKRTGKHTDEFTFDVRSMTAAAAWIAKHSNCDIWIRRPN